MNIIFLTLAAISQAGALIYLHKKAINGKESMVLIIVYLLGIYTTWDRYISVAILEYWMLLLFIAYQWCFGFLLLYVNKKIKEQQM